MMKRTQRRVTSVDFEARSAHFNFDPVCFSGPRGHVVCEPHWSERMYDYD
jgi:hypothetical protein